MVGLAAVAMAVAGCSGGGSTGTPAPATATSVPGSGSSAPSSGSDGSRTEHGAPKVSSPLDASKYLTQPCAVLTSAQTQGLNQPKPGKPDLDSAVAKASGPSCSWRNSDALDGFTVGFLSGNKKGLDDTYRGKERFDAYFEETSVDGYPAVFNDTNDARDTGRCTITAGISDTQSFVVALTGVAKGQASCEQAKQVASLVIQTIKGGAG